MVLILLGGLGASSCGGSEGSSASGQTTSVVAAFYPLAYAAEQIGALEGAEADAVDLLEGLQLRGAAEGEDDLEFDPHVWLDPLRYAEMSDRIASALGRPRDAAKLRVRLEGLDREYEAALDRCKRREIVTSHAAFGYLAERYDLEQIAITGLSPEAEPTPQELEDVVEDVRAQDATTVFFETLVSPSLAETVARETGASTAVLNPLEGLTEEELDRGEDYFSLMRTNLQTLREALECG